MGTEICFASLERGTIIDIVENGLTRIYGKTLADIRAEPGYQDAEEMTVDAFVEWKAKQQATPITWEKTTEAKYMEMLEVLPPIGQCRAGFLVGEPWDHEAKTGAPRYQAFRCTPSGYYVANRPMTVAEFRSAIH